MLFVFLCSVARAQLPFAQKDSIILRFINDTTQLWTMDKHTKIYFEGKRTEIWKANPLVKIWKVDNANEVWTLGDQLKFWKTDTVLLVWDIEQKNQQLINKTHAMYLNFNDSTHIWNLRNNQKFTHIDDTTETWDVVYQTRRFSISDTSNAIALNDSTLLWSVTDTSKLWVQNDTATFWLLKKIPQVWRISSSTCIWTINPTTEFWMTDGRTKIWIKDSNQSEWHINDKIVRIEVNDTINVYPIDNKTIVWQIREEPMLWQPDEKTKIWHITDSLKVWKETPPPPKPVIDPLKNQKPKKEDFKLSVIDEEAIFWTVDENTRVWSINNEVELWTANKNARLWNVNDSTNVWTIDKLKQITQFGDSLVFWSYIDSTNKWAMANDVKLLRANKQTQVWTLSPKLNFEIDIQTNKVLFWDINPYVELAFSKPDSLHKVLIINDSTQYWNVNEGMRFWIANDETTVWKLDPEVECFFINDSSYLWRVDEQTRISQTIDSVTVWWNDAKDPNRQWNIKYSVPKYSLRDSLTIYEINDNTKLWIEKRKSSVWRLDSKTKTLTINDTIKLWTYTPKPAEELKQTPKKTSNWKIGGNGSLNFSQVYYSNWDKPIPNQMSVLAIINLVANYAYKNLKYENTFELNHERYKMDEYRQMRIGKDRVEINLRLGYKAFKHWNYSSEWKFISQIFNGYLYPWNAEPSVITKFMSPGFMNMKVGLDFKPSQNFSLMLAPITFNYTYVLDTTLKTPVQQYKIEVGKNRLIEKGGSLTLRFTVDLSEEISYANNLILFSNYLHRPENVDILWESSLVMKVNKFLNSNIRTQLMYNDDKLVPLIVKDQYGQRVYKTDENNKIVYGKLVQFNELLSIGFSYKF